MSETQTVALGRRSLHQLRAALERALGVQAAPLLQEAGFASGEAMTAELQAFVKERYGVERMQDLDAAFFGDALSGFFSDRGWGEITVTPMGDLVLLVDSANWAEATPGAGPYPSCHVSAGLLADIFTRIAGGQFAAMEVQCRSRGDGRCRFLLAAPETLTLVYERMTHGMSYESSLGK